jgi:NADH:ubiquinone oxidoreductase subunit 3 (subunit A)
LIENCFRFNPKQEIFYFEIEIFSNNLFIMTLFYSEFSKVGILFLFSVFLASIILFLSYRLSTYNPDTEKVSAYECGFDPYDDARNVFDVRFYLVAILFIVFDLEAVYFFPWCVSLSFLNLDGLWGMIDFILELLIGFIYAWEVGALEWE